MTLFDSMETPIKAKRYDVLSQGRVVFDADRCVQCGVCSYNCPVGIDVRAAARQNKPISDSHCLSCGQCVVRCPRGVPRFEKTNLFE
jgi:ferredoxin